MLAIRQTCAPLVSIIIPCYNAERFLPETLASVAQQTLKDFEIIAVNDGSTDGTLGALKRSGLPMRIENAGHRGVSHARQLGTRLAQGRYLQYLDADDLLLPNALELKTQSLESNGADVVFTAYRRLEETADGAFTLGDIRRPRLEDFDADAETAVLAGFWTPLASLLYRHDLVRRMSEWRQDVAPIEDARFLLDAAHTQAWLIQLTEVGAHYRAHRSNSHSSRSKVDFVSGCFRNGLQVEQRWRQDQRLNARRVQVLASLYNYTSEEFCRLNRQDLFTDAASKLHELRPESEPFVVVTARYAGFQAARRLLRIVDLARRIMLNLRQRLKRIRPFRH